MKRILSLIILLYLSGIAFAQEEDPDQVFIIVEVMPEFAGGMRGFYNYIRLNMRYPDYAKENGIEGKVMVQFEIDTSGAIVNESVIIHKGVHESIDKEAVRLLKECPDWNPARYSKGGPSAKVRMIMPITFLLDKKKKKGSQRSI